MLERSEAKQQFEIVGELVRILGKGSRRDGYRLGLNLALLPLRNIGVGRAFGQPLLGLKLLEVRREAVRIGGDGGEGFANIPFGRDAIGLRARRSEAGGPHDQNSSGEDFHVPSPNLAAYRAARRALSWHE